MKTIPQVESKTPGKQTPIPSKSVEKSQMYLYV